MHLQQVKAADTFAFLALINALFTSLFTLDSLADVPLQV